MQLRKHSDAKESTAHLRGNTKLYDVTLEIQLRRCLFGKQT